MAKGRGASLSVFCAYGAEQALAALERFEQVGQCGQIGQSDGLEQARRAAVRLQVCLTLFAPCFPPTRIAFWKRRLRRLIRVLNALSDHLRLMQAIEGQGRVHLRLQQRIEMLQKKAQMAWERLHKEYIPNEIRGLARRRVASGEQRAASSELKEYARARWAELARVNLKWLAGEPLAGAALEGEAPAEPNPLAGEGAAQKEHRLEIRWGRLQLMVEIAEMLAPLLSEELPLQALQRYYQELDAQRFRARAAELLTQLKEEERTLTLRYQGHLRGFRRIEREFHRWIQHFQKD